MQRSRCVSNTLFGVFSPRWTEPPPRLPLSLILSLTQPPTLPQHHRPLTREPTSQAQDNIQRLVKHFFRCITQNEVWARASAMGILSIPVMGDDWEARDFHAHIVPVWTRQRYNWWLVFHLQLAGISAFPIDYPTVPKGQSRIRLMFHAANTEAQVAHLAATICAWAAEMIAIEEGAAKSKIPRAAQQVYALMAANA